MSSVKASPLNNLSCFPQVMTNIFACLNAKEMSCIKRVSKTTHALFEKLSPAAFLLQGEKERLHIDEIKTYQVSVYKFTRKALPFEEIVKLASSRLKSLNLIKLPIPYIPTPNQLGEMLQNSPKLTHLGLVSEKELIETIADFGRHLESLIFFSFCLKIDRQEVRLLTSSLTKLRELRLVALVDTESVEYLQGLPELRILEIQSFDSLTDQAMQQLSCMSHLEELRLIDGTQVTDQGLMGMAPMPHLKKFGLTSFNSVSGEGLSRLIPGLGPLVSLELSDCPKITDGEMTPLASLPYLEELDLKQNEQLTDKALTPLFPLKGLRKLTIGPQITEQAANNLMAHLPRLEIIRG